MVFDNGIFSVYLDGELFDGEISTFPYRFSPNTHATTTLGFKPGFNNFNGYVDDVSEYLILSRSVHNKRMYF